MGLAGLAGISEEPDPAEDLPPSLVPGGGPNDSEQPGLERAPAVEPRFAREHFQVRALKDLFGKQPISAAAAQGPAEALAVMLLQQLPQPLLVHSARPRPRTIRCRCGYSL